jgi:signal transduction histidine kinase
MRLKTWLVAAIGLGSLVLLTAVSMTLSARRTEGIYEQLDQLNNHHRNVDVSLRRLRSDVNLSGIFVRDYLLDVERDHAPEYRQRIAEFRRTNNASLQELSELIGSEEQIASLQTKLDDYWQAFDPLFDWTPGEKIVRSASFLRREVVPRREAVLAIAQDIETLNNDNLAAQQQEVTKRLDGFRSEVRRTLWQTLLLGLGVAAIFVYRVRALEQRSDAAEHQMRELSQQLVNAQEEERKHLSRELHDHVAQVLTGLRMELGRIERANPGTMAAVTECRALVDELFGTVRALSLGLRPSMLDDFGLQAALEWHVRDFMARSALNIDLQIDGEVGALPDKHRTCVYRVVQEALTNCARHAQASHIWIRVVAHRDTLRLSVRDNGIGVNPDRRDAGLGLRGIDERVKELSGSMLIKRNDDGGGTTIEVRLPVPAVQELNRARLAG